MRIACVMAALLCAAPALAQDRPPPPPPLPEPRQETRKPPLSPQDAELVKEMALLEKMDLLRNLDLFEPDPQAKQSKEDRQQ